MSEQEVTGDNGASATKVIKVNYPANSNKQKKAESDKKPEPKADKQVKKIISGEVVQHKKSLWSRFKGTFVVGDDMQSVGNFIMVDIVIPAIKTMISEAVSQGTERTLFGDASSRGARRGSIGRNYTNYSSYSSNRSSSPAGRAGDADSTRTVSNRDRSVHNFDSIVLETRGEAEEVIDALTDLIKDYDVATVSDLYELVGITGSFTDDKWGWFDMRGAGAHRVRDGYLLNLPKTSSID